tara:strand:+ start:341 stop:586 length:246 start_codon:yes stop_codon:yes gene_type:complete
LISTFSHASSTWPEKPTEQATDGFAAVLPNEDHAGLTFFTIVDELQVIPIIEQVGAKNSIVPVLFGINDLEIPSPSLSHEQ